MERTKSARFVENFLDYEDFVFLMVVVIFRKAPHRSLPCLSVCKTQEIFSTLVKKKNHMYLFNLLPVVMSCTNEVKEGVRAGMTFIHLANKKNKTSLA